MTLLHVLCTIGLGIGLAALVSLIGHIAARRAASRFLATGAYTRRGRLGLAQFPTRNRKRTGEGVITE